MRKHITSSRLLIAALALAGMLGSAANTTLVQAQAPAPSSDAQAAQAQAPNSSTAQQKYYAPVLVRNAPLNSILGVETGSLSSIGTQVAGVAPTWIRRNSLRWDAVEKTEGNRDWSAIAALEDDMKFAAKNNLRLIVMIWGAPSWAQKNAGSVCGPISDAKIAAFASFVNAVVQRYSQSPYNVKYWEIWNEMDLPQSAVPTSSYGCWGNPSDPYWGGGYYASVIKQVGPAIRNADPAAKIVMGGMLLDCSPERSGSCVAGKYLEGILRAGGAPFIDYINFHAYDGFNIASNQVGVYDWGTWGTTWNTTGPVVGPKAQFIKRLLARYNITGKSLINTESALICWECASQPSNYGMTKAYYVVQASAVALSEGLAGNVWYSWDGWFQSQLFDQQSIDAFKTFATKIGNATFGSNLAASDIGGAGGVKGFKFNRDGRVVWVLWSLDGATKSITLPGTPIAITDALGASQPASQSFQLTVKPLYIEW